ncbi:hypothetical protein LARV_00152 [Longilinea arvoryzae]|uniref:Uncharacterized protein n=1 Tax=Longilinea arvoryzae TaxID=360412 RepID=A0A0S7BF77_9CHLR|nr:hypothetical protein [Longilinea arvoryzae]GAP12417.1 hypothetical protein LARV_00152 [Longilinea arvoryzae]
MKTQKKSAPRILLTIVLSLVGLCMVLTASIVVMNALQPELSVDRDHLTEMEKVRLAEGFHLRHSLGDQALPGFAQAEIPVVIYNGSYAFLIGLKDPADGWTVVPSGKHMGSAWEVTPGEDFDGQPYYRQKLPASGETPEGFTVRVGDAWAASLGTMDYLWAWGENDFKEQLPAWLQPIAPVKLFMRNLLLSGSDVYATLLLHESVHAYQGMQAEQKLEDAETVYASYRSTYPYDDQGFQAGWQTELETLNAALETGEDAEAMKLTREFLQQRADRREAAGLSSVLIRIEQLKEWEEGIAKYSELTAYRLAGMQSNYQPLAGTAQDSEFNAYRSGQKKWDGEIQQILREANADEDGRFYYTGFAQAALLDRFAPGWQSRLFDEGVTLEGLLAEAVQE